MISALTWVPPGACRAHPKRYDVSQEERAAMSADEREDSMVDDGEENEDGGHQDEYEAEMEILKMDEYDDKDSGLYLGHDDSEDDAERDYDIESNKSDKSNSGEEEAFGGAAAEISMNFSEMSGALANTIEQDDDLLRGEEESDAEIKASDAVLLVANTEEDEFSFLEMHIYDQESGALYTHHDITLPEIPLCLEWLGASPCGTDTGGITGNDAGTASFVAVGTFQPGIELWNLDVVDPLEPTAILGGASSQTGSFVPGQKKKETKKKKKKEKGGRPEPSGGHSDSVLCLKWNTYQKQALASASADTTVKIWDITTQDCVETISCHTDKVLGCTWHPLESSVIATAGFDRQVLVSDVRAPPRSLSEAVMAIPLMADPDDIQWDPHNGSNLVVGTENGRIVCYDVRKAGPGVTPLYEFQAHENDGIGGMSFSPHKPGLLATCSPDQTVKLWDVDNLTEHRMPQCLGSKDMSVGGLFGVQWYMGTPHLLATGGSGGQVALWHTDDAVLDGVSTCSNLGNDSSYLQSDLNGGGTQDLGEETRDEAESKPVEDHSLSKKKKKK